MPILVDHTIKVLVQGPASRQTDQILDLMRDYGSDIIARAYPAPIEGGESAIPGYQTVEAALEAHPGIEASFICPGADDATALVLEAMYSSIGLIIISPEISGNDCLYLAKEAMERGIILIGPGSQGIMSPGHGLIGSIPLNTGFPSPQTLLQGPVSILTRSVLLGLNITYNLKKNDIGLSTLLHLGSSGTTLNLDLEEALFLLDRDAVTQGTIICPGYIDDDYQAVIRAVQKGKYHKPAVVLCPRMNMFPDLRTPLLPAPLDVARHIEEMTASGIDVASSMDQLLEILKEKISL